MLNIDLKDFIKKHKLKSNQTLYLSFKTNGKSEISNLINNFLNEKNSFIFESVEKGKIKGRYTIFGKNPDKIWEFNNKKCYIYSGNKKKILKGKPKENIEKIIEKFRFPIPKELPDVCAIIAGYFSYDAIRYIENIPNSCKDDNKLPDLRIIRPKELIIHDNLKKKIYYIYNCYSDEKIKNYNLMYREILSTLEYNIFLSNYNLTISKQYKKSKILIKSNVTKKKFIDNVRKAKKYIKIGDIFQVVLSQRFETKLTKEPIDIYKKLRVTNPSPFMYFFNFKDFQIIGASPEILVRLRDDKITIRPIAGTRPRGKNQKQDLFYKKDLLKVIIEKYSHVMHIVSNVTGHFNDKFTRFETLMSGFPAGTVSGAPKIRAMEIIDKLEKTQRKVYSGGIGYFSANGNFDTCIALRTAITKQNKFYVQAGAGIVADSKPINEYFETINKAKALLNALN